MCATLQDPRLLVQPALSWSPIRDLPPTTADISWSAFRQAYTLIWSAGQARARGSGPVRGQRPGGAAQLRGESPRGRPSARSDPRGGRRAPGRSPEPGPRRRAVCRAGDVEATPKALTSSLYGSVSTDNKIDNGILGTGRDARGRSGITGSRFVVRTGRGRDERGPMGM